MAAASLHLHIQNLALSSSPSSCPSSVHALSAGSRKITSSYLLIIVKVKRHVNSQDKQKCAHPVCSACKTCPVSSFGLNHCGNTLYPKCLSDGKTVPETVPGCSPCLQAELFRTAFNNLRRFQMTHELVCFECTDPPLKQWIREWIPDGLWWPDLHIHLKWCPGLVISCSWCDIA